MQLFILKTNLASHQKVNFIKPILNLHPSIINWNVDIDDIDNVLRIESKSTITEPDIICLLKQYGISSETLTS